MTCQEATTTSYGKRLTGSIKGIASGFIMFIIGTIVLFWNEGNFVAETPSIFASEIKKKLPHFSERNIDRYLKQLKSLGLIEYKGSPKKGGYYPV